MLFCELYSPTFRSSNSLDDFELDAAGVVCLVTEAVGPAREDGSVAGGGGPGVAGAVVFGGR